MKPFMALLLLISSRGLFAQTGPHLSFERPESGHINVSSSPRSEPPGDMVRRFHSFDRSTNLAGGATLYVRYFASLADLRYFGYEVLVEPQKAGAYRVTFGRLGVTPLEVRASTFSFSRNALSSAMLRDQEWSLMDLPAIPNSGLIDAPEQLSVVVFVDRATGARLIDDITVRLPGKTPQASSPPLSARIDGPSRDFAVADADLEINQPQIRFNGIRQVKVGQNSLRSVRAPLIWVYIPGSGRFVLSLAARADMGFAKAGEVRGGSLTFSIHGQKVNIDSSEPITSLNSAYNLYVLHMTEWQPTSENQREWPMMGTISPGELRALLLP